VIPSQQLKAIIIFNMKYRSKNRDIILRKLRCVTTHPTAEELYLIVKEEMPTIGIATVYRNLDQLCAAGQILMLEGEVKRFDGNVDDHLHVRCVRCGRVFDLEVSDLAGCYGDLCDKAAALGLGVKVEFEHTCPQCLEKLNLT
jgi:Fe2+ or Zn2+ uptake regulation protein